MKARKSILLTGVIAVTALALAGCAPSAGGGTSAGAESESKYSSSDEPLRIWSDNRPHSEILQFIVDEGLLPDGVELDIIQADYSINENDVVANGDADANYIDHIPFWETDIAQRTITNLEIAAEVHIEPQGIYSAKYTDLDEVPDGATVALSDNVTNFARGLFLLQSAGLLELDRDYSGISGDDLLITEDNIVENPKNLTFTKVADNSQIARSLADVDLGLLYGSTALGAELKPADDALYLEDVTSGNPYINIFVAPTELKDDPRVVAVAKALVGPEVADYILATYDGSVIPVNPGSKG